MSSKKTNSKNVFPYAGEFIRALMSNAQKTKEGVEKYLMNIDPKKMMDYLVDNYDIDLHAKFSFVKKQKKKTKKLK